VLRACWRAVLSWLRLSMGEKSVDHGSATDTKSIVVVVFCSRHEGAKH
jgi:hypothetical protein